MLAVNTAGMLVRREVLEKLGGFDRELPLFATDIDFGWRAARAGHRSLVVPQALVFHAEAGAPRPAPHQAAGPAHPHPPRRARGRAVRAARQRDRTPAPVAGRPAVLRQLRPDARLPAGPRRPATPPTSWSPWSTSTPGRVGSAPPGGLGGPRRTRNRSTYATSCRRGGCPTATASTWSPTWPPRPPTRAATPPSGAGPPAWKRQPRRRVRSGRTATPAGCPCPTTRTSRWPPTPACWSGSSPARWRWPRSCSCWSACTPPARRSVRWPAARSRRRRVPPPTGGAWSPRAGTGSGRAPTPPRRATCCRSRSPRASRSSPPTSWSGVLFLLAVPIAALGAWRVGRVVAELGSGHAASPWLVGWATATYAVDPGRQRRVGSGPVRRGGLGCAAAVAGARRPRLRRAVRRPALACRLALRSAARGDHRVHPGGLALRADRGRRGGRRRFRPGRPGDAPAVGVGSARGRRGRAAGAAAPRHARRARPRPHHDLPRGRPTGLDARAARPAWPDASTTWPRRSGSGCSWSCRRPSPCCASGRGSRWWPAGCWSRSPAMLAAVLSRITITLPAVEARPGLGFLLLVVHGALVVAVLVAAHGVRADLAASGLSLAPAASPWSSLAAPSSCRSAAGAGGSCPARTTSAGPPPATSRRT